MWADIKKLCSLTSFVLVNHFPSKSDTIVCDKQGLRLQKIVTSLAARKPATILQRVEVFPSLNGKHGEYYVQKGILETCSVIISIYGMQDVIQRVN
jgi:hypothetical protein